MKKVILLIILCLLMIISSFTFGTTFTKYDTSDHTTCQEDKDTHDVTLTIDSMVVWYHACHPEQEHLRCIQYKWYHYGCECISYEYKCCCGKLVDYIVFPCIEHGFN